LRASPANLLLVGPFFCVVRDLTKHEFIPVALAARAVYEQAFGAALPDAHLLDRLNGLAYCLARFGRVYAIDERRPTPRRLSSEEIACGHFRHGGRGAALARRARADPASGGDAGVHR